MASRLIISLGTGLVLLAVAAAASAQRVPQDIRGFLTASAGNGAGLDDQPTVIQRVDLGLEGLAQLQADWSATRSVNPPSGGGWSYTVEVSASAEAYGGLRPAVVAQVATNVSTSDDRFAYSSQDRATASMVYEVGIAQRSAPPVVFVPPLRLVADVLAEATFEGADGSRADASVIVSNPSTTRFFSNRLNVRGPSSGVTDSASASWAFLAAPGDVIQVALLAQVVARTIGSNPSTGRPAILDATATAVADPFFRFDQAAFDLDMAALGLPTFALEDYYSFTYSPSLIPELGTGSLAVLGLAGLWLAARRRKHTG